MQTLARHPGASRKAVARAAFREMIEAADRHPEAAVALQEVGLLTRNSDS
jgi:ribosomal protein S18 acetylase RimI-like enzyme